LTGGIGSAKIIADGPAGPPVRQGHRCVRSRLTPTRPSPNDPINHSLGLEVELVQARTAAELGHVRALVSLPDVLAEDIQAQVRAGHRVGLHGVDDDMRVMTLRARGR
jgi:hypothetical protein